MRVKVSEMAVGRNWKPLVASIQLDLEQLNSRYRSFLNRLRGCSRAASERRYVTAGKDVRLTDRQEKMTLTLSLSEHTMSSRKKMGEESE